jgi:hypothetical protein
MKQAGDESEGEDSPTEGQEPAGGTKAAFEGLFTAMGIDWDEHNDRMLLLDDLPRFVRLNPRASIGTEVGRAAVGPMYGHVMRRRPPWLSSRSMQSIYSPSTGCAR